MATIHLNGDGHERNGQVPSPEQRHLYVYEDPPRIRVIRYDSPILVYPAYTYDPGPTRVTSVAKTDRS